MLDPRNIPPVEDDELLARYVTQSGQFRSSDNQVKPNLFIPHPREALSVTRHLEATSTEIWAIGNDVSTAMGRGLYGRVDIRAVKFRSESLKVIEKPLVNNPNHADIEGWPEAKEDQKAIALKLAASASKLISPPSTPS
jgi:hypothetical protein